MRLLALSLFLMIVVAADRVHELDTPPRPSNPIYACDTTYPHELDVGIYWGRLGADGRVTWAKQCLGVEPANFAPTRDTMIFLHGAQPNMVRHGDRVWLRDDESGTEFALPWLASGWNVGIFQATQFMDEDLEHYEAAEGKIWNAHYFGDMRYRYTDKNGAVHVADAPMDEDLTHIFLRFYADLTADASPAATDREMRLVGHSLGTQLAMRATFMIAEDAYFSRKVDRVALLDPVHSNDPKSFFKKHEYGHGIATVMGFFAHNLRARGVAIEMYKSTVINRCLFASQTGSDFVENTAFSQVDLFAWGDKAKSDICYSPALLSDPAKIKHKLSKFEWQITNQHIAIVPFYLLSLPHPPLVCQMLEIPVDDKHTRATQCTRTTALALSAAMPTREVIHWQAPSTPDVPKRCFRTYDNGVRDDDAPTMTLDPADDGFYLHDCSHVNT